MDLNHWLEGYDDRDWQTTEEGTIRFALVGLGWWTTDVVIPAIRDTDLCETTVVVSSSTEKATRLADEHDIDNGLTYEEFHDGAATDAYDAVYIGTPNAYHLEHAEAAAAHEKAVLCEKPMEATVERAETMVETFEDADVPLMVAYRMHTDPAVRRARELVEAGFLGDPVHVYGNNSQRLLEMIPDENQWRLDPEISGYGTSVMDLGIYPLNTARYLLRLEPKRVSAEMASLADPFADVPDERSAFRVTFEDEVQMVGGASQNAHEDTHLKLVGTDGIIELAPAFHGEAELHLRRDDVSVTVTHESMDATGEMREEFDYFADRVLTDEEIFADGRHGLEDMRLIESIHEAAASEQPLNL